MVLSLQFQFREDKTSGFAVMANNIPANQVPAGPLIMHGLTLKERKSDFCGNESPVSIS